MRRSPMGLLNLMLKFLVSLNQYQHIQSHGDGCEYKFLISFMAVIVNLLRSLII